MAHLIAAVFENSEDAESAVTTLNDKGYACEISVFVKDEEGEELRTQTVKKDVSEGFTKGGIAGVMIGAFAGVLTTISSIVIPGIGALLVGGPLAAGLTGAAIGGATGGLIGALVDAGLPPDQAKIYENNIRRGNVLLAVNVDHSRDAQARRIFESFGARETSDIPKDYKR